MAIFLCVLAGCRAPAGENGADAMRFETWNGQHARSASAGSRVIHSEEEWVQLWRDIGREPPRAWRRGEESAVGIFLGQRRSGGFAIEVLGVDRDGSVVRVSYREKTPSGGVVAQVLTSPWAVVAVPVASAEVQVVAQSSPRSPIPRQQK